jgi:hypothetical protein
MFIKYISIIFIPGLKIRYAVLIFYAILNLFDAMCVHASYKVIFTIYPEVMMVINIGKEKILNAFQMLKNCQTSVELSL